MFFKTSFVYIFLIVLVTIGISPGFAQTAEELELIKGGPVAGSTPGGVDSGAASDSELWRMIRSGEQFTTVGKDKRGAIMIQSTGQDWRMIRNGPLPKYMAIAILGMLCVLSIFFAARGRIKIDAGTSGKTIKRFSMIERIGHWLLASSFIILALTGLNLIFGKTLLIPIIGKSAFASLTIFGKFIHNYVAFAFMAGLVLIVVMWIKHNIPNKVDINWILKGGGIFTRSHPAAKKFNAGQKLIFWVVVLCGISISLSGWALMNPYSTQMFADTFAIANNIFGTSLPTNLSPIEEQQYQTLWHAIMAGFMIIVVIAHIYIGSIGMEGAIGAVTTGDVDLNWAKEHHSLWVEEVENAESADSSEQTSGIDQKEAVPQASG